MSIDEDNIGKYGGRKFFLEDVGGALGVSTDNTFVGVAVFTFSDFLGDRRIIGQFQTISSFQNFDIWYQNLSRRMQWNAHIYDNRDFFVGRDRSTGELRRAMRPRASPASRAGSATRSLLRTASRRPSGAMRRELDFQTFLFDPEGNPIFDENGNPVPIISPRADDFPYIRASLVGDKAIAASHGWGDRTAVAVLDRLRPRSR